MTPAYFLGTEKAAADLRIGDTIKAVRKAMQAKNVDAAYQLARGSIRSRAIQPPMLQRLRTPSAGITPNEAELWRLAARPGR